jgi:hypothetical protein
MTATAGGSCSKSPHKFHEVDAGPKNASIAAWSPVRVGIAAKARVEDMFWVDKLVANN